MTSFRIKPATVELITVVDDFDRVIGSKPRDLVTKRT